MREVRPGVWHWQSPHPDWSKEEWWPELVSSYGIEARRRVPAVRPARRSRRAARASHRRRPHRARTTSATPARLGLPVHTPPADTWQDWVEKFGIDPERVRGMESEDLAWLRAGEGEGHFHGPGEWPFGMTAYAGREDNDLILWLPSINAIVTGDSLSDFGDGLGHPARRPQARDARGRRPRPPAAARPAGRARATRARRADGSRGARARPRLTSPAARCLCGAHRATEGAVLGGRPSPSARSSLGSYSNAFAPHGQLNSATLHGNGAGMTR